MDWKARIRSALSAGTQSAPDDDVVEELAQHARADYEAARAEGCTEEEAHSRVNDLLMRWRADATSLRRRTRRPPVIEPPSSQSRSPFIGVSHDLKYAVRLLLRQRRFAAIAILTMALGIGMTSLLFSVTHSVLMQPLPWGDADRIVVLKETRGGNPPRFGAFTNTAYLAWTEQAATLEAIGAWSQRTITLTDTGDPERIRIAEVSGSIFKVLDARPLIGTLFESKDETAPVAVLSESLWRQRFGAENSILGRSVRFDGKVYTVLGVLPDRLAFPDAQSRAWIPFRVAPVNGNALSMFNAIARLRQGVSPEQAAAEGTARGRFAPDTGLTTVAIFGSKGPVAVSAEPLREALTRDVRRPLIVLLVAVGLLLATATANIASLQLARATGRRREIAMRSALGADSLRVTRQLIVENVLVSLAGGIAGLLLAWTLHRFLPSVLPADFPRLDNLRMTAVAVLFTAALSVLAGIACGLIPALRLRRLDLVHALTEDGGGAVGGAAGSRTRALIMAGQVGIACILLIGASLLGRSFFVLLGTDRGYDPAGVLAARLTLSASNYTPEQRHELVGKVLDRLATTPGVLHASFTSEMPLGPGGSTSAFTISPQAGQEGATAVQASPRIVSAGYFAAAGLRVSEGRGFSESDTETAPPVVVVNRAFARKFLRDRAIGIRVPMGAAYEQVRREAAIVGVVDDVRYVLASDSSLPEIYFCYRQFGGKLAVPVVTLILRTTEDPMTLARPLKTAVREADSRLVAEGVSTMEERMLRGLARPRLYAIVLGGFAVSALLVAAVGLFGVLSYSIAQRSRELALRTALGASKANVVRLVFGQTMVITAAGIVAGVVVSFALMQSIAALLHGVTPHDSLTFVGVPIALWIVAAATCLPPSLKAAKLDPLRALRS